MTKYSHTPTPDLDIILLRAGYPVHDGPKVRQLTARRYRLRCAACRLIAARLKMAAAWFEARAGQSVALPA